MGQSLDANSGAPTYAIANVSETFVKHGQICTNGLGCATGGDRSLGDFLQVTTDGQGAALVSYVFDTSANTSAGEDTGPEVISRQLSGPSLLASVGTVSQNGGPGLDLASISDPTGDADYSANGTRTAAPSNLDLTGASLANGPNNTLIAAINTRSLKSLTVPSSVGGPDASWLLRWTVVNPGTTGNGHIYYAGMDNNVGAGGSGSPTFFVGDTAGVPPANPGEHTKYIAYPQTQLLNSSQASYDSGSGVITMRIPRSAVGSPSDGTALYSITAFSATSTSPQSAGTLFNLIDATPPFELVVGPPGTVGGVPSLTGTGAGRGGAGACIAAAGRLAGKTLGRVRLGMTRTRARELFPHWSTRSRRDDMDFFFVCPKGVRAGYPSAVLLRTLSHRERRAVRGRVVLILTANRHYALHGVRPATRLARVARRLHVGRGIKIGLNTWYLIGNGPSRGVLKVRHGVILEVGIANKQLTSGARATFRFLKAFR
jgi:hypothetical protein